MLYMDVGRLSAHEPEYEVWWRVSAANNPSIFISCLVYWYFTISRNIQFKMADGLTSIFLKNWKTLILARNDLF